MMLALQMPEWLSNFWSIYSDMITPILVTLICSFGTALALKIKSDAKTNAAKADLQIKALKEVANREDNKPELEAQAATIDQLSETIRILTKMFDLVFQNSDLDPETKEQLKALMNTAVYGSNSETIKELEEANAKLTEQIETLKTQVNSINTEESETEVVRERR